MNKSHDGARCFLNHDRICPIFADEEIDAPSCPIMVYHQDTGYWACGIGLLANTLGHQYRITACVIGKKFTKKNGKKTGVTRLIRWKE